MKTKTSKKTIWARVLFILPLLAGLLYGFSTKEVVEKNMQDSSILVGSYEILELKVDEKGQYFINNEKISLTEIENLEWKNYADFSINAAATAPPASIQELVDLIVTKRIEKEGKISVCTYGESGGDDSVLNDIFKKVQQEKATPEMVAEYKKLVKYYNSLPKDKRNVKQEDANRIMAILSSMTSEQKSKAEKIKFDVPPPPPPAPAPAPKPEKNIGNVPAPPVPTVPLSGDGNIQPPPPPAPPTFEDLVEKGATFYYEFKEISPEEARKLVEVDKKVNVQITKTNGKSVVRLLDKEE